jgi:Type IV secretory pathway, protease TraF
MANRPRKLGIRAKMTLIFGLAAVALALSPFLRPALAEHYSLTIDPQYQSCLPWTSFFVRYGPVKPKIGMLVVFHDRKIDVIANGQHILVVKYVAGVPGDRVKITRRSIWINGHYWGKRWLMPWVHFEHLRVLHPGQFTIPDGRYLIMGTTPGAYDGRYWGLVPARNIIGQAWPA